MILWKPKVEITIKLKKSRGIKGGNNYKGRDHGPFKRLCNFCKVSIMEYTTYDIMQGAEKSNSQCQSCKKKWRKEKTTSEFFKKCSNEECNELIYYRNLRQLNKSIKFGSQCKTCVSKELSVLYSDGGFQKNKSPEEKAEIQARRDKSFNKYWEENPDELKALIVKRMAARVAVGYEMFKTEESRKATGIRVSKLLEKQNNETETEYRKRKGAFRGSYKNISYVAGLRCQGPCEKWYIENLIAINQRLPVKPKNAKTSFGYYLPDFEFEDRYIEIKSEWTYAKLYNENTKQFAKIKEVGKMIKPVEILIISDRKKGILKSELYN